MTHNPQSGLLQGTVSQNGGKSLWNAPCGSDVASELQCPISEEKPAWQHRLEKFVGSFVTEIETKFEVYHAALENMKNPHGNSSSSVAKELGAGVGGVVGGLLAYYFVLPAVIGSIASKVGEAAGEQVSEISQKNKRKGLSRLIYYYQENKVTQRKKLIEAGLQVFRSYEMQIMGLESKNAWQPYVSKLGQDGAHRVINFCDDKVDKFTVDVITKGVVEGKSKKRSSWLPMKRGLEVKYHNKQVTTNDIFTKVGLVNFENTNYFIKKDGTGNASEYGYRILFGWESDDSDGINVECAKYYRSECKPPENVYTYLLSTEDYSNVLNELTTVICSKEMHITKETIEQVFHEFKEEIAEMLQDVDEGQANEELTQLKKQISQLNIEEYAEQLKVFLEDKHKKLQEVVQEESTLTRCHISKEHEGTRASVHNDMTEELEVMRQVVERESNLTRTIITEGFQTMRTNYEPGPRCKPVTLDFSGPVEPFVGREDALKELYTFLHKEDGKGRVVVTGLDGVGKSELARQYAAQNCNEYERNIVWINSESYCTLCSSFFRLATKVGVKTQQHHDSNERRITDIVSDVYDRLGDKCLLIFDNAQKCKNENKLDEGLKIFLPDGIVKRPHVIITSCMANWDSSIPKVHLKMFQKPETLELLEKVLGRKYEKESALQVGGLIEHLPLALKIIADYIVDQDITICKFIEEYEQKKIDILELGFPESSMDNNAKTIFTTFEVILDKIPEKGNAKIITILNILAYLTPSNIPKDLFSNLGGEIEIRNAIQTLKKYSLINQEKNESLFKIHKLVQDVIRKKLKKTEEESVLDKALQLLKSKHEKEPYSYITQQVEDIWYYASNYPRLINQYCDILPFPLHRAVQVKQLAMVQHLLHDETDINVFATDRGGMTALYRANQQEDNMEVIQYLIQKCSQDPCISNEEDWKMLEKAAEQNEKGVLKFLIDESGAEKDLQMNVLLHLAAQNGKLDVVKYLINNGVDVLSIRNGVTVLHEAAYSNNYAVIEFVLESIDEKCEGMPQVTKHDYINATDRTGDTPLMWAAKAWNVNAVKALRGHDAAVSVTNKDGKCALDLAQQTAAEHDNREEFLSLLQ